MNLKDKKTGTLFAHTGSKPEKYHGAVNVPPHRMSTIVFNSYDEFEKVPNVPFSYGRAGTPSSVAFEEAVASIDGAYGAISTPSGLSAILSAMMAFTKAGDHILVTDNCYGPSRKTCEEILRRFGVDIEYFPPMIGDGISKLFRPNTKLVYMESPGSLTFEVQDVGAITAAAKKAGIRTAIDNSWATPLFFKPIPFGIDISVMSATKYIGGHSDILLGVASANEESFKPLRRAAQMLGYCAGSEELYLGLRGLRTLPIRMQQHQKNALELAQWLQKQPQVKRVAHPALPDAAGHANWKKYYTGSSGTFSIVLHEKRREKIAAMLDGTQIFSMGFSWGGFESLLFPEQPQPIRTAEPWTETGFNLRIHVGLEDIEDLKADLDAGLKRLG
jgi:cystathionine beta-lyase